MTEPIAGQIRGNLIYDGDKWVPIPLTLVQQLRQLAPWWPVCAEAADEIERLTAENRYLFEVIMDDALLVERYNAFVERATLKKFEIQK